MRRSTISLSFLLALLVSLSLACGEIPFIGDDPDLGGTGGGDDAAVWPDGSEFGVPDSATLPPDLRPASSPEICNGLDDDGDKLVDEGCGCKAGTTQKCFPWPTKTIQGICVEGTQTCKGGTEFAVWGTCDNAITPRAEICGNGIDEDCSGADFPCPPRCGDKVCNGTETCNTCPADCGKCCGNGTCDKVYGEDCKTCAVDCGACAPFCGDGTCNGTEDCVTCSTDCGVCPTQCDNFTFGISARAVDIVFIIDQSGSMSQEIANVKQYLNQFSTYISGVSIDYHVIMLASRGTSTYYICIPPPLGGASCADGPRYQQVNVNVQSTDSLSKFQSNITAIESFMRPNSYRQIVEITDDNSTSVSATAFNSWITARTGYSDYVFHSIVAMRSDSCTARIGQVYMDLSNMTKGSQFHICTANWSSLFTTLGQNVAGIAKKQYPLTKTPLNSSTVTVTYNGVTKTAGTDYDYDSTANQVVIKGTLPPDNTPIKICYQYKP